MRILLTLTAVLLATASAPAEVAGMRVWVTLEDPAAADPPALAGAGAEAVALPPALADETTMAAMRAAGLRLMALVPLDGGGGDVAADWDGLLVTALPEGESEERPARDVEAPGAEPGSLEHLLAVKRAGDERIDLFRALARATEAPIYLAVLEEDTSPETAQWQYLDRHALLSEGLIDGVLLRGTAPDLRRPRLSTPEPIVAGLAAETDQAAAAMTVLRSRDVDVLLTPPVADPVAWLAGLQQTIDGLRRAERDRLEFGEAVERGELEIVAGLEPEDDMDVATIHGVAQSFTLEEPAEVMGVGLYCILRGAAPLGLEDLRVTIRPDADGAPDFETVLAEGAIPAAAYAEPGYAWGYARLDEPVALEVGTAYWLHAEDAQRAGNSFVWRITKDGSAYEGGHAWSRTYDYEGYDWVFRVLAEGEGGQ